MREAGGKEGRDCMLDGATVPSSLEIASRPSVQVPGADQVAPALAVAQAAALAYAPAA